MRKAQRGYPLASSAIRPQEALGPLATASLVRRVTSLHEGPATGRVFDALVSTGDNTDNHEHVERDWYLTVLSGGTIIPNTGAGDRWESVQTFGDPLFYNPESSRTDMYKRAGFPRVDHYFRRVMGPVSSPGVKIPWYAVSRRTVMRSTIGVVGGRSTRLPTSIFPRWPVSSSLLTITTAP